MPSDFEKYSLVNFARWLHLQEAAFGEMAPVVNKFFNRRLKRRKMKSGYFSRDFKGYLAAKRLVSPKRAFEIGQAIGYATFQNDRNDGFASGAVALIAAGHISSAIRVLGHLMMTSPTRSSRPMNAESRSGLLVALRFVQRDLAFLTSDDLRQPVRRYWAPLPQDPRRHFSYAKLGKNRERLNDDRTPRGIFTDFLFNLDEPSARFKWVLDRFGAIKWVNRAEVRWENKADPISRWVAFAAHAALAVRTYPQAAQQAWELFRAVTWSQWERMQGAFQSNEPFREYMWGWLPRVADKLEREYIMDRQPQ